ncbi:hypothetical protein [Pseudomonas aeruginosa]|uniref:hypothetical protein n=1 Tax=Pseudomonas aeruginosa TaxID=287 RepID=UPI000A9104F2|nr:hypothetical protein [Pseudomonas aeruginosa]
MSERPNGDSPTLRQLIESFIQERLQGKLDKLKPDEDVKRQSLLAGHRREASAGWPMPPGGSASCNW